MTEDEMRALIERKVCDVYFWICPLCDLHSDESDYEFAALNDLRYHIEEDHKGED